MRRSPDCMRTILAAIVLLPVAAAAQRVDDNAVAQAEDAFGIAVSGESLGLYGPFSVRGFSPTAAGNIRFDGLYIDLQGNVTSRLVNSYRIFVGASVLGHPFPAPSGIADYTIRKAGKQDVLSVAGTLDGYGTRSIELDGQLHDVLPNLGVSGGVALYRYDQWFGGRSHVISSALIPRWQPAANIEILPFLSRIDDRHDEALPTLLLADGAAVPHDVHAHRFVGQHWAKGHNISANSGVTTRVALGDWQLRGGLFRSVSDSPIGYSPLLFLQAGSDVEDRSIIAERDQTSKATSGELQLSREFGGGKLRNRLYLATWGRDQRRAYGATDEVDLGSGLLDQAAFVARPDFDYGAQTRDHVRQLTVGLAYEGAWTGVGAINLGIQKTDYEKTVVTPTDTLPTSHDRPFLYNASAAIQLSRTFAAYAGVSRGLEESDVAPSIAVNRNEAPPAIRTRQIDTGLRWTIAPHVTLVAGAFRIDKPYYGLDSVRFFRALGQIRHQGLELSIAGSPLNGLSIVGGAVRLDARVSGDEVAAGIVGRRPVGSSPLVVIASADYRFPGWRAVSVDANLEHDSRSVLSVDGLGHLPARDQIDLGTRYRFKLFDKPAVFRVQVLNVTNKFSWDIAGSNALQVHQPRTISFKLTTDI